MSPSIPGPKPKMLSGRRVLGLVAMIAGFLVVQACGHADNPRARTSEALMKRIVGRQMALAMRDPVFQAAFTGLSPYERTNQANKLFELGIRRLSDKDQIRYVALRAAGLNAAPEDVCARDWLLWLDSTSVEEFWALKFAAVQAEIRGTPRSWRTDSTALELAAQTMSKFFLMDSALFLRRFVRVGADLTEAERCAAHRAMYGRLSALPEPRQADYARALNTFDAEVSLRRLREKQPGA